MISRPLTSRAQHEVVGYGVLEDLAQAETLSGMFVMPFSYGYDRDRGPHLGQYWPSWEPPKPKPPKRRYVPTFSVRVREVKTEDDFSVLCRECPWTAHSPTTYAELEQIAYSHARECHPDVADLVLRRRT